MSEPSLKPKIQFIRYEVLGDWMNRYVANGIVYPCDPETDPKPLKDLITWLEKKEAPYTLYDVVETQAPPNLCENNDHYRVAVKCCDNCGFSIHRYGHAAICTPTQKPLDYMCVCDNWKPLPALEGAYNLQQEHLKKHLYLMHEVRTNNE